MSKLEDGKINIATESSGSRYGFGVRSKSHQNLPRSSSVDVASRSSEGIYRAGSSGRPSCQTPSRIKPPTVLPKITTVAATDFRPLERL